MVLRSRILNTGLLLLFIFVVLSATFSRINLRPAGVYQRGRAHAGHRTGFGRSAARNFKSGIVVAKNGGSFKLRKSLYKSFAGFHGPTHVASMTWMPEPWFPVPQNFVLNLSPVLNL